MSNRNKYYHCEISVKDYPFNKVDISKYNYDDLYQLYIQFNKSINKTEKYNIAKQLPIEIFPKCRFCGNIIVNVNFKLQLTKQNMWLTTPTVYCREIDNKKYFLSCCEDCLLNKFKDNPPKSPKYYYMRANKYGQYSFGYNDDDYHKICSATVGVTLKSMIKKWGEKEGKIKWESYCNIQAKTNSFEYKQEKYGWTINDFNEFNKKRAVTLNNLISKYGDKLGEEKWNEYLNKQQITKSYEYMINKYGKKEADKINKSKGITLNNFINKYGEIEGKKRFNEIIHRMPKFYSNISQKCFDEIDNILKNKYTTYYATKNTEYGVNLGDEYICLDYFIKELNICIEFNGTVFHADKRFYTSLDTPNPYCKDLTAEQIWNNDNNRYNKLLTKGIKTYVIWEYDYINKNFDVNKFITETLLL